MSASRPTRPPRRRRAIPARITVVVEAGALKLEATVSASHAETTAHQLLDLLARVQLARADVRPRVEHVGGNSAPTLVDDELGYYGGPRRVGFTADGTRQNGQ